MRKPLHISTAGPATLVLALALVACSEAPSAPNAATIHVSASPVSVPSHDIVLVYDTRLDDADAAIEKAIVLVDAAENPGVRKPFGGHDEKAIRHLLEARNEIAAAKAYADQ